MVLKYVSHVVLLNGGLFGATDIRRISTNICFPARILEIDLRLIDQRDEQIVRMHPHPRPGRRANAQPVQTRGAVLKTPILNFEGALKLPLEATLK